MDNTPNRLRNEDAENRENRGCLILIAITMMVIGAWIYWGGAIALLVGGGLLFIVVFLAAILDGASKRRR